MTTKIENEYPSSPPNDESDGEEQSFYLNYPEEEAEEEKEKENDTKRYSTDVAGLLAKLQSSGALIKKSKQEYRCLTCNLYFSDWEEQENHLIKHISLPSVILDKLPSDDEDLPPSGDENWSDEDEVPVPNKQITAKTPQKIDISQILKKTGISLKKPVESDKHSSDSALNKLSGLGFTIKKNSTSIKKEKLDNETDKTNDVVQKLGKLGGIKLKLKSDGNNTNSFKVVNGLKDFKASDDEDEASGNEEDKDEADFDDEFDKSNENNGSDVDHDSDEPPTSNTRKSSDSSDTEKDRRSLPQLPRGIQTKLITPKKEPNAPSKQIPKNPPEEAVKPKQPTKVAVKQTPKRPAAKEYIGPAYRRQSQTERQAQVEKQTITSDRQAKTISERQARNTSDRQSKVSPERDDAQDSDGSETTEQGSVIVKQEIQDASNNESKASEQELPIFSSSIKSERSSPPLSERSTPVLARVKSEPEGSANSDQQNYVDNSAALLPVKKSEDASVTVIEINGDSNDEDDDCCVVSTTPAPDVKPVVPKVENTAPTPYSTTSTYSTSQSSYNSSNMSSRLSTAPSTEKQHNFNWNAPDSKPPLDMLEKSADDIFESLLSTKKENMSISDASEYISLDTLGPQHTCDICNTRFTDITLLEEHKRATGHSKSLVAPSPSTLMPYNHSSNILSSLLPVKQLAEQVGKLSNMSSGGPGFTHQQNVMINIQAYPGAGGVMVPPQPYNTYNSPTSGASPGQNMHGSYSHPSGNLYGSPNQPMSMPGQYQGSNYMGQGYGQYQSPMSKSGYPSTMPPTSYSMASSPYSTASPLQSMQQSVYGQSSMMSQQAGAMGPPGTSPSHSYGAACSPGGMKPPGSGIKIQNIQTFPPGQMIGASSQPIPGQPITSGSELPSGQMSAGQAIGGQIPGPTPIRLAAGANIAASRPRMPTVRGQRPTIRPGIQVHGQVRGGKVGPRMPMKRPGAAMGGPGQKRRSDMLLPGKHDNEDCHVMSMQKQRDGLPLIHSVQGAKDKLNLGSQISITKKTVNKEANAMANVLASRGISVKQKQKSRSPTPERPLPHIPNLGAGVSIKHTSRSSKFSIPEAKVGGGMLACKICKKMFMNHNSLQVHMSNAHHAQSKIPVFKCDECPASYPKSLQLQHHKRVFHNVVGPNRELGLPVVDLSQEDNLKRLSNLGIYSFIPLANREQANGCFGIPVISVHSMQNGLATSLQALGADGLLSLGPLKPLPNS
ncbi:uncharacterized protein LOC116775041 [Danaus plexippus]|uniref:uncharacterized protein LOC116775041 n=1 Tax=Danaus plexippus TaxID=13037 RepID=UPI002AB12AD0|nr:uncharacterized protein LOC116775041 [Danaus plexippus]